MRHQPTIIEDLMKQIPWGTFDRLVAARGADDTLCCFDSRDHLTAMIGGGWVYIMANRPNGILYVGVTGDIARRAWKTRLIVAGNPGWQDLYEQII